MSEKHPTLDSQDMNTILAALRYYQQEGMGDTFNRSDDIHDLATNGDTDISMDADGIDELCVRLNCGREQPDEEAEESVLIQDHPEECGGTDYILRDEATSCWITVGNISVYLQRNAVGVAVSLFPKRLEAENVVLSEANATFEEAEIELEKM